MARILFFSPPSKKSVYFETNIKIGAPSYPNMTLATLAGNLTAHQVKIIDLDLVASPLGYLVKLIKKFNPNIVASSAKTTEYSIVKEIMEEVKGKFPNITTIIGGVHVTAFPKETALEKCFDVVVEGEGDTTIPEILTSKSLKKVPGIVFRDTKTGKLVVTPKRELIKDINKLPYPAWNLFNLSKYKNSRLSSRANPVGHLETSRGCSYHCNFCNKLTFGTIYRVKEPKRVVDEMEYMLACGFKEIHITDDSFTQNIVRAKEVCREIIRRKLKFPWSLINGVRVNLVDLELFQLAKEAGCWQVGFGIETGSQRVLKRINKQITLSQVRRAVSLAEKVGLDTFGFFIFGLAGDTEKSMAQTVKFAKSLPLSTAKFDICVPYPGTNYYCELEKEGRIRTFDWSKYNVHQTKDQLFNHPNVSWDRISFYYKKGFRDYYLRPSYIIKRIIKSIKSGDLFFDISYFLKVRW
ncbi:MAG: radical SAM protein [Candidatus Daviesbacteria bacterium]